ncbi:type II secretion system protein E (plasmid) [Pseudarthrobacter chlorophenolicus A6]|uniref:Type II secretion system protein E n=1 Tax=Pseudarthrobacter chlorophenolicus (strain ATCC 700700 / DSM 12829 / CIP 107037 / JCM 12360 / KCTC 9906 / NCIMB 13794 / A6) TaxID=452863 RepID=B8HI53_PSECP|nr:ATPase, T2SS/T4P/T4SS family [Pseudarthrobacter chlorophenolicus]ACL42100.1 type II secretion system protein E [Pseudarthrobacter chlorophenolicus A6]SDQ13430.1 type IV pilus assembly protein PilB [Pseudarthrobacter chlorophenolicus]
MARRVTERRSSEFPRHRAESKFADRSLPTVALLSAANEVGETDRPFIPRNTPAPVAEVQEDELPENYFQTDPDKDTWLEEIVQECMKMGASDLLLNFDNAAMILTAAARVDGRMRPVRCVKGMQGRVIVGKFKAEAKLATSGRFAPEETIYLVDVHGEQRKARVAAFRTADGGDAIVMRLPPSGLLRQLTDLDFSPLNLQLFYDLLGAANRMIIIAGPMGSGKTTTAHAALMHVATPTRTVWTVEDPVERTLPGLIQLEVDEDNGAGFDALLPALVRSDYDTLFLGEIRDQATAAAGVRQAKAGRQVITTIHANNNVTALLRLIDLAVDSPLSVMDSVKGVVSQRLIGKLNPDWDGRSELTKYKGRIPIHEVLTITDELTEAIMTNQPLSQLRELAETNSMSTFAADVERLVTQGITDEEEARRVIGE